jgi:cation diffusion facilitator family transporter
LTEEAKNTITLQKSLVVLSLLQFIIKIVAYTLTDSIAILTDAMESIVNIIATSVGLFALYIAAKPKDLNHPYGHGKVEFLSASLEGILIGLAGLMIIYQVLKSFLVPHAIQSIDLGTVLIFLSGLVNFFAGKFALKKAAALNSTQLNASGLHLVSDAYTTFALTLGLILLWITKQPLVDTTIALILSIFLIYTSLKIVQESFAGIMDEADEDLLTEVVDYLQKNRKENWIDLHNLRIIKYGSSLHFDAHVTVPWYFNVHQAHNEIDDIIALLKQKYGEGIEFFIHTDGCLPSSCSICKKHDCLQRLALFQSSVIWTGDNVRKNAKHSLTP